jgi:hypothetical protein
MTLTVPLALAVMTMLVACSQSPHQTLAQQTNELLQEYLQGQTIHFAPLTAGATVTLPAVVSVDGSADGQCVSLSFARADLEASFIEALFRSKDARKLKLLTPFTEPGIETVLTRDHVVLNLYSGVVMHLEPRLQTPGGITPFKSGQVKALIVKVIGPAVHAPAQTNPDDLKRFSYLRSGKAFAYESRDLNTQRSDEPNARLADAFARMSMSFAPTVIEQAVDPQSVACAVKPFRN